VQSVQRGTAAAKAGIRGGTVNSTIESGQVAVGGDIITSFGGKAVTSSEDLANDVATKKPGDSVTIGLKRANGSGGYKDQTVHRDARGRVPTRCRTRPRRKARSEGRIVPGRRGFPAP